VAAMLCDSLYAGTTTLTSEIDGIARSGLNELL
jgi:hypothetical protein